VIYGLGKRTKSRKDDSGLAARDATSLGQEQWKTSYGDEALQLFRDRARDERGFLSGLRLWLDLLGDLAISIPREYRSIPATVVVGSAALWGRHALVPYYGRRNTEFCLAPLLPEW
jgi:hypothetical protein